MPHLTPHDAALPIAMLDILPNPVWVMDDAQTYVWVNKAFEALFNVAGDDVVGACEADVLPDHDLRHSDGKAVTMFTPDGAPCEMVVQIRDLTMDDGTVYHMGMMDDVTALTHARVELAEQEQMLEAQAGLLRDFERMDPLTGCINRRALHERVAGQKPKAAVLMMGIDGFKAINEAHSHEAGDEALKHFANIAHLNLRPDDILARVGGEEFAVYLPDASDDDTNEIGARILTALAQSPFMFDGQHIPMTVSIGGSCNLEEEFQLNSQMRIADECLYAAKLAGRNQMVLAN